MQEKQQVQQQFWKAISNQVQLVFEDITQQLNSYDEVQAKTGEIQNFKNHKDDEGDQDEAYLLSEGPSRQIFQLEARQNTTDKLAVNIRLQNFIIDQPNGVYLTNNRNYIPQISVSVNQEFLTKILQEQKSQESSIIIQLMLCQKSHNHQRQKFKVIKGGISGCTRKKVSQKNKIQFKGLKFNYNSNPDKNSKLLIALYKINKQRARHYFQILSSKDIFIIEDRYSIVIQDYKALNQYFQLFGVDFMERQTPIVKINKSDKYGYHQQIANFQKYLIKKNRKILHIIHLAFKFPHFVQIYFKKPDIVSENQQVDLNEAFGNALRGVTKQISQQVYRDTNPKLVCNHFDPQAKIILNINVNLRKVRFFMRKEFTKLISFIATQQPQHYQNYFKFPSIKELKEFYVQYHAYASKQKTISQPLSKSNQSPPQIVNASSLPIHFTSQKKIQKNRNDEDFNQKELQQQLQSELEHQSSQNYSLSQNKRTKRLASKRPHQKKTQNGGNLNSKQAKYPTRIKTRQMQYNQQSDSKKALLNKKIKEKQIAQQLQQQKKPMVPGQMPMGMGMPVGMPVGMNMPFQIINPINPQNPTMGMFPMMAALQQGQTGGQQGQQLKKDGNTQGNNNIQNQIPQNKFPINGQQMGMGMPGIAGMPGMIGIVGGMPGMMQAQGTQNSGQGQTGQMGPMMINPAMMNPAIMNQMMMMNPSMMGQGMMNPAMMNPTMIKKNEGTNSTTNHPNKQTKQDAQNTQQQKMPTAFPVMGMGVNPSMMQIMPGMIPQGMLNQGNPTQGANQPMVVVGPNGMYMMLSPNPNNSQGQTGSNNQGQTQNQNPNSSNSSSTTNQNMANMNQAMMMNPNMMGMINPGMMGMNPMMMGMMSGMNPNQGQNSNFNNSQNSSQITANSSQMGQNPYMMMGIHPQMMGMSNASMAQMMNQNKIEPKKQLTSTQTATNNSLNQKTPTNNLNPNQKNSPVTNKNSKSQLEKKQDKTEGLFPPNMQQGYGMTGGMPMFNPMMGQGQMMMTGNKQTKQNQDKMIMGMNMMGINPQNLTPQMMQQLQQMGGNMNPMIQNQMMQNQMIQSINGMGINPMMNPMMNSMMQHQNSSMNLQQPNSSTTATNSTQSSSLNGANINQSGQNGNQPGMNQMMNNPQYQQFIRNQMMQQMMMQQKWPGMMPPKKDDQQKK